MDHTAQISVWSTAPSRRSGLSHLKFFKVSSPTSFAPLVLPQHLNCIKGVMHRENTFAVSGMLQVQTTMLIPQSATGWKE